MNIGKQKKMAIISLYSKGTSVEILQIVTGLSKETINCIIRNASKQDIFTEWDNVRRSIKANI